MLIQICANQISTNSNRISPLRYLFVLSLITYHLSLISCSPQEVDKITLPVPPTASFDVQTTSNPNKIKLVSNAPDAFLLKWDLGNGVSSDSSSLIASFPFKGTYNVTLTAFGKGGSSSVSKSVVIAQDEPTPCTGNVQLLTGCSSKTWKLIPQANAFQVGPDAAFSQVWYANSATDVVGRACQFNDEYTFTSAGVFTYDNKGDFWADTDGSGNLTPSDIAPKSGCQPNSALNAKYKDWGSNTNKFTVTSTDLTVVGSGAFICLYKVANGAEVTSPQASVKYTIKELSANKMVLLINYGGGFWQFTLVPK